jgi:hypothetical protein
LADLIFQKNKKRVAKGLLKSETKMKAIMILGANAGLILGMSASILGECAWPETLWHSGVAALAGGLLGRWWGKILFAGLNDALEQRRRERAAAAEVKTAAKI